MNARSTLFQNISFFLLLILRSVEKCVRFYFHCISFEYVSYDWSVVKGTRVYFKNESSSDGKSVTFIYSSLLVKGFCENGSKETKLSFCNVDTVSAINWIYSP